MQHKSGVNWKDMDVSMWIARDVVERTYQAVFGFEAVLTSARRPTSPGGSSKHTKGLAIDVRVWDLNKAPGVPLTKHQQRDVAARLRTALGPDYLVLIEGPAAEIDKYLKRPPHLHIQYNGS